MKLFPKRMPRTQYASAIYLAGRFSASREHWMAQAKSTVEHRSLYVAYARAAHRAYINTLRIASEIAERSAKAAA